MPLLRAQIGDLQPSDRGCYNSCASTFKACCWVAGCGRRLPLRLVDGCNPMCGGQSKLAPSLCCGEHISDNVVQAAQSLDTLISFSSCDPAWGLLRSMCGLEAWPGCRRPALITQYVRRLSLILPSQIAGETFDTLRDLSEPETKFDCIFCSFAAHRPVDRPPDRRVAPVHAGKVFYPLTTATRQVDEPQSISSSSSAKSISGIDITGVKQRRPSAP